MTIKFSNFTFTEPIRAAHWVPPRMSGLYVILVPDARGWPRQFRAIYFGETEDYANRGFLKGHHRYRSWVGEAGSESNLWVAIYPTAAPEESRLAIEKKLIAEYAPNCNRQGVELSGLMALSGLQAQQTPQFRLSDVAAYGLRGKGVLGDAAGLMALSALAGKKAK